MPTQANIQAEACPCATGRSSFTQSIQIDRPHTLLTRNVRRSGQLTYRYEDTGEEIDVPNVWYNQTYQMRVNYLRSLAADKEAAAESFERHPIPSNLSIDAIAQVAQRFRATAKNLREEADALHAAGKETHPVAAVIAKMTCRGKV